MPQDLCEAIDLGCGIGRIAKGLLCLNFKKVDVLEMDPGNLAECEKGAPGNLRYYSNEIL